MTCFLYLRTIFIGIAQASLERVLNSLPEGLMVAFLAWLLLRIVGRRNAGTRFAVWFIALITVAAMPLFAGIQILLSKNAAFSGTLSGHLHLSLPLFWSVPIFALWASGVCLACARLMAGLYQVRSIRKSCVAISLEELNAVLRECVQDVFKQSKVSASITLAESDRVRVPSAMGFLRPMIVFPSGSLGSFAPDELAAVLTHELAHVQRRDAWTNLLQKVIRAIFFFHPAVWWIDARLTLEREMACDDAVLAHMGDPQTYAHCLIELLERSCAKHRWPIVQTAVRRAHEVSLRITQILDPRRPIAAGVWKGAPAFAGIFSIACIAVLLCTPQWVIFSSATLKTQKQDTPVRVPTTVRDAPEAEMVPASLHLEKSAKHHKRLGSGPYAIAKDNAIASPSPSLIAEAAKTSLNQKAIPVLSTYMFVETTAIKGSRSTIQGLTGSQLSRFGVYKYGGYCWWFQERMQETA